jgi:hypothetical protein
MIKIHIIAKKLNNFSIKRLNRPMIKAKIFGV